MDCSLSGSSVRGILQARILELIATPSPSGAPGLLHWQADYLPLRHLGSPYLSIESSNSFIIIFPLKLDSFQLVVFC